MFGKLFGRDYRHFLEKGDKYFRDERYADARHAFQEALQRIDGKGEGDRNGILLRLEETGNQLGLLNLVEAEHALVAGNLIKAEEHLDLVLDLATDPVVKDKAQKLLGSYSLDENVNHPSPQSLKNCAGCAPTAVPVSSDSRSPLDHLSDHERFELLIQTLPGELSLRYAALGEMFAHGYLLIHDGDERGGEDILANLPNAQENDIVLYELALLNFKKGQPDVCEQMLQQAIEINGTNPLCRLGLAQLLTDTGRLTESLPVLQYMIDNQLLADQAIIFLGDVYLNLGTIGSAMDAYARALEFPHAAKAAAERLIPMLQESNRDEEAAFLFKKYLKGCC
jgi:tetratricopeptide (TPR) repeat protein